jgi:hypothetical protein
MRIGLDFDNTIVCYDHAIARLADELLYLPEQVPRTKLGLRDYLRREGRESEWTAFQGELYGPGMRYAQPFEGAIATMHQLTAEGHDLTIVSHRSRFPYAAGQRHDLHYAAQEWIATRLKPAGIFATNSKSVHFMESRRDKLAKIDIIGCAVFLDDLPEVLQAPEFPSSTIGILFSPNNDNIPDPRQVTIFNWKQLITRLAELA